MTRGDFGRRAATLPVLGCLLFASGCDEGPDFLIKTRVTFVIAAPTERFRHLAAEVSYPDFATPGSGSSPDCSASRYLASSSFDVSGEGVLAVSLDAHDVFPPTQGLPPRTYNEDSEDDSHGLAGSLQTVGEEGFEFRTFECVWSADRELEKADFVVEVIEASDASGSDLASLPNLIVTSALSEFEDPHGAYPTDEFHVYAAVTNEPGPLGALQFDLVFLGYDGLWIGGAGSVQCLALGNATLATFNNKGNGVLSGAMIDLNGIETPREVVRCTLGMDMPALPEYLVVDVIDAADVEGKTPHEWPVMAVSRIVEIDPE